MSATVVHACPFCGFDDVMIEEVAIREFTVECPECRCMGPIKAEVMAAIDAWNAAPRPAAAPSMFDPTPATFGRGTHDA